MMHLAVVTCLVRKKVYFRTVFFYKDDSRNRIISILTVHVVNDVHTYISLYSLTGEAEFRETLVAQG